MTETSDPLSLFHPLIARWFRERIGTPTEIQAKTWPEIVKGGHVLFTAPTGSGKTLAAFLWAVNQLLTGAWPGGRTRVLYVSPLKALNTDIRRNLLGPLEEIESLFAAEERPFPRIRVETRSGDTPQAVRRQMLRRPPEILITTPESLNLLLSARSGRAILDALVTVILDEIHTVVDSKRGVHLITAVDRLVPLCGEFQRLAVSATIRPLETVAEFVGGLRLEEGPAGPRYAPRAVTIVRTSGAKSYDLKIRDPEAGSSSALGADAFWGPYVRDVRQIIARNRSTLIFTKSRGLCETLTWRINAGEERPLAYSHHGSLARELRLEVEAKLKSGDLKAIVATSSLELGIDIGALDEVVLVKTPPSISSSVQRIGRAGHSVGAVSRATFLPTDDRDFVEAAVAVRGVLDGEIEAVHPVENALDVLAQILVSMAGTETWDIDRLYAQIRASWPYRRLSRTQFDLVLDMLAGRYAGTRIPELRPRLSIDRIDNNVAARKGALIDLFISGGTIPNRGYFHLRHEESGALIGELDEEFVWEASPGQTFSFGAQPWTIRKITHNEVLAVPARPKDADAPFWKGEVFNRNAEFSAKIAAFLEEADSGLDDPAWRAGLEKRYGLDRRASERIVGYLLRQKSETARPLPHAHHLLVEHVATGPAGVPGNHLVLHAPWGGRVNRPFALALEAAWEERFGQNVEIFAGDDAISLQLPHEIAAAELLGLVDPARIEVLLRQSLERSGTFGARFRENAGRALLIPKNKPGERLPLWMSRLRSQRLLQAVLKTTDFPILLETWRTCLKDEFDLEALKDRLVGVASGEIRVSECRTTRPSPMAAGLAWLQVNRYMYADDALQGEAKSRLKGELLREVIFTPGLRPSVSRETIRRFEEKRRRLAPGYSPGPDRDLVDWIKERVVIPWTEWQALLDAVRRDHPASETPDLRPEDAFRLAPEIAAKLVRLEFPGDPRILVTSLERIGEVLSALDPGGDASVRTLEGALADRPRPAESEIAGEELDGPLTALLGEWLAFYGPLGLKEIGERLVQEPGRIALAVEDLKDEEGAISGALVDGEDEESVCETSNFESLLRLERASRVPIFEALPAEKLPLFLARVQGLASPAGPSETGEERVFRTLEQLAGYKLPGPLWESEILAARVPGYSISFLDAALRRSDLRWQGDSEKRVRFFFESDLDLLHPEPKPVEGPGISPERGSGESRPDLAGSFSDPSARYEFGALLAKTGSSAIEFEARLWEGVWSGRITNDTWSALRRGLQTGFRIGEALDRQKRSLEFVPRRGSLKLSPWRENQAYPGSWLLLPRPDSDEPADLVAQEELRKDRVRLLLDRYGILFREILFREDPPFRWPDIFHALRLMELSGELLTGYFFEGIPGPQFVSPSTLALLRQGLPEDAVYWLSAVDPASVCGLPLDALRGSFPKRVEGSHLVFHGSRLVATSERRGRSLSFAVPPDHPQFERYLAVLSHLVDREYEPERRLILETINGEPAMESPYLAAFKRAFDVVVDRKSVSLYRRP